MAGLEGKAKEVYDAHFGGSSFDVAGAARNTDWPAVSAEVLRHALDPEAPTRQGGMKRNRAGHTEQNRGRLTGPLVLLSGGVQQAATGMVARLDVITAEPSSPSSIDGPARRSDDKSGVSGWSYLARALSIVFFPVGIVMVLLTGGKFFTNEYWRDTSVGPDPEEATGTDQQPGASGGNLRASTRDLRAQVRNQQGHGGRVQESPEERVGRLATEKESLESRLRVTDALLGVTGRGAIDELKALLNDPKASYQAIQQQLGVVMAHVDALGEEATSTDDQVAALAQLRTIADAIAIPPVPGEALARQDSGLSAASHASGSTAAMTVAEDDPHAPHGAAVAGGGREQQPLPQGYKPVDPKTLKKMLKKIDAAEKRLGRNIQQNPTRQRAFCLLKGAVTLAADGRDVSVVDKFRDNNLVRKLSNWGVVSGGVCMSVLENAMENVTTGQIDTLKIQIDENALRTQLGDRADAVLGSAPSTRGTDQAETATHRYDGP